MVVFAAPGDSISTNKSVIENGESVTATVTLTDTAAWNIKITGTGAANCSKKEADVTTDGRSTTKSFSLTCNSTQEGTIVFTVTGDITSGNAETKDVSLRKEVTVTKARSSNNNLSDLKVDGATVAGFSGSKTSYTINDVTKTSVSITATAVDSKANVSGTGTKSLQYGANSFNVVVTAENGAKKTYKVVINRKDTRSSNNSLKSLSIDKGKIDFNKDTTNYSIKVDHDVNEVNITAAVEDSKANVTGTGKKTIQDYSNEFNIVVTAENGSTKAYTIKVIRKDVEGNYGPLSTDNSVNSISITNHEFTFNPNTKEYNVLVGENESAIEIKVVPNDSKATVSISNNTDLKPGLNKVSVKVTSEKGDVNEYLFNVYKIGEEKEKEKEDISPSPKEEKKDKGINIWLIISIIEFIGLIVLSTFAILLLKKQKQKNEEDIPVMDKHNEVNDIPKDYNEQEPFDNKEIDNKPDSEEDSYFNNDDF